METVTPFFSLPSPPPPLSVQQKTIEAIQVENSHVTEGQLVYGEGIHQIYFLKDIFWVADVIEVGSNKSIRMSTGPPLF